MRGPEKYFTLFPDIYWKAGEPLYGAAPLVRDTLLYLYDRQKALAGLQAFEQSIGGTLEERLARKNAAWRSANRLSSLPPKPA